MSNKQLDSPGGVSDNRLTVGVVRGGDSEEREISLKTGRAVVEGLEEKPCRVLEYDTSPDLGSRLEEDGVDCVFIALHGSEGEDGVIQGMLDWRDIPYTGPRTAASALCMDKLMTRQFFDQVGVETPNWFVLRQDEPVRNKKGFEQLVVKPRAEGSSIGMSIVEPNELEEAVRAAREYADDVIVEENVEGYEVTVGVVQFDELTVLPPVGIRPGHDFFDFETKYTKGLTEYDVPAELPPDQRDRLLEDTKSAVRAAGTESLCRVDYIVDEDGTPRLLEINTIPGLTQTSLLPKAARQAGIEFDELIWGLIEQARRRQQCQAV
ncbi:MAG: D-alanine--D-alanine ligase [bacterium]